MRASLTKYLSFLKSPWANDKGAALIIAMTILISLTTVGLVSLQISNNVISGSRDKYNKIAAFNLANGGANMALQWFNQSYNLLNTSYLDTNVIPKRLSSNNQNVTLPGNHPDPYTDATNVSRSNTISSFNTNLVSRALGGGTFSVSALLLSHTPEIWEITSTGVQANQTKRVAITTLRSYQSFFADALFGRLSVTMSGNARTDSYNSANGPYGGSNQFNTGGDIASNGPITLSGNARIQGNATPGPANSVSMSGNAAVTGSTQPATEQKTFPSPTIPPGAISLGAFSLSGNNTYTLTAGTYQATSLSISGNARLTIDATFGPVILYVSGTVSVSGNGIANTPSQLPTNFTLYVTGTSDVQFTGNANFYGAVYAPNSLIRVSGNGELYGAMVGNEIRNSGNGNVHYDNSLSNRPDYAANFRVLSWKESF